jgi:glycosyltransferase involved in cell wall biosynthesis
MFFSKYLASGITTITPELKDILINEYKIMNIDIGIWSSGVSLYDFNNINPNDEKLNKHKLIEKKFLLMYHGEYSPTRGIENLIEAIGELDLSLKNNIGLFIIGMPENKIDDLRNLAVKKGIEDLIEILPKVSYDEITRFLQIADAGIIPLPPENNWWRVSAPLKSLEYLAAGKPIIATNIPFHCKIFEKGNCGVLVKGGSSKNIAEGISVLYNNHKNLPKMGELGRDITKKFYTWEIMSRKLENFIKKL